MTAAGVQNIDPASYLPPSPSISMPDSKGTGAAGKPATDPQASDTQGEASDFQSELALQQTGTQQTDSAIPPKADSGKPEKKRSTRPEDNNQSAVAPVQVTEPQKQILPLALALPQSQENAKPDENAKKGEKATSVHPEAQPNQTAASNATPATAADSGTIPVLPLAAVRQADKKSEDLQDQAVMPTRTELKLPASSAEPVSAAVQETVDAAPSSPSALAFAARLAAAPQNTGDPAAADASPSAASGSQTQTEIPVRYAATAQIIQSAALGTQQDGPKKDAGEARTDMVLPRFETVSEAAPSSGSAAPQQAAPTARTEQIIEPPAAPPASSHDIRVQVPDNNGGSTQVRFVESGGEVRVSVRTADDGLAQNLRTHLNDLTQRLSDGGISAEIWKPASSAASSQNDQQQAQQDGRGSSGGQGSGGQGGQQDRQQKRPAWLEEMEASLHGEQN